MCNAVLASDPIPRAVMVAVFAVHVFDTSTTCLCAGVCRAWRSLAMNRSSHSGIVVFKHCLRKESFFRSSCNCDTQLVLKIIAISAFKNIVHLNLCNVHLSTSSLQKLARALRFHRIRPQQLLCFMSRDFQTGWHKFSRPDVTDCCTYSCFYIFDWYRFRCSRFMRMFLYEAGLSKVEMADPQVLMSLIDSCWNSMPCFRDHQNVSLMPFPLPERLVLLELLLKYFAIAMTCKDRSTCRSGCWSVEGSNWQRQVSFQPHNYFGKLPDEWKDVAFSFTIQSQHKQKQRFDSYEKFERKKSRWGRTIRFCRSAGKPFSYMCIYSNKCFSFPSCCYCVIFPIIEVREKEIGGRIHKGRMGVSSLFWMTPNSMKGFQKINAAHLLWNSCTVFCVCFWFSEIFWPFCQMQTASCSLFKEKVIQLTAPLAIRLSWSRLKNVTIRPQ